MTAEASSAVRAGRTPEEGRALAVSRLLAQPDVRAAAFVRGGGFVEPPPGLEIPVERRLPGRSTFDLVHDDDRGVLIAAWERFVVERAASANVRLRGEPPEPATLHLLDVKHLHGVSVAALVARGALPEPATERAEAGTRACRATKSETAIVLSVDEAFSALLGWRQEEVAGRRSLDLIHPDDHPAAIDAWIAMLGRPGGTSRLRQRHLRADGSWLWVDSTNRNLLHDPAHACVVTELVDVSAEVEALDRLRLSEDRLARAAEIAGIGWWEVDAASLRTTWSDGTFRICGLEPGSVEPVRELLLSMVPEEERDAVDRMVLEALAGRPEPLEHRVVRPDGDVRLVRVEPSVDVDGDGRVVRVLGITQDVTEQRRQEAERARLEERMRQAQQLESLGLLAGGVAHDFNNLLAIVLGNAGLAVDLEPAPEVARALRRIETAAERAAELTAQLLSYAGQAARRSEDVYLGDVVRETGELASVSIPPKVVVHYELAGAATVHGDPTQLRQVVMNLLTNAAEAIGDERGSIVVRVVRRTIAAAELATAIGEAPLGPGPAVVLEVEDSGAGMDAATLRRIFDPFFTTKATGRGLGLASMLGIVRGHGGAVLVESAPGRGSRFVVALPPAPAATRPPAQRGEDAAVPALAGTVLIVDDEPEVREVARLVLEPVGLATLQAANGREALELLRRRPGEIDLVLLDMTMPELDGAETLGALRQLAPGLPVIVSSGHARRHALGRLPDEDVLFLYKPYRPRDLLRAVGEALRPV
ncbi:MAG: PAS domain-containing protein [Thermoleophilia bacterium]